MRQRVGNRPVKNLRMEREDSGQGGKDIAVNEPWEKMTQDNPWSRVLSKGKDDQIALVVVGQICSRHLLPEGKKKGVSEDNHVPKQRFDAGFICWFCSEIETAQVTYHFPSCEYHRG